MATTEVFIGFGARLNVVVNIRELDIRARKDLFNELFRQLVHSTGELPPAEVQKWIDPAFDNWEENESVQRASSPHFGGAK